jgi:VWFA-related protein
VVDLSGSVIPDVGKFRDDIRTIGKMLRPDDRVRLVSFGADVVELSPMQAAAVPLPVEKIQAGGTTSMNDGVLYGLAWPGEANRRHLVVVFTDGADTSSTLDLESVPIVASRANAVMHLVLSQAHNVVAGAGVQISQETLDTLARRLPQAASRAALIDAAVRTGGEAHQLNDAVKAFRQVLDDFRQSYVLYYTPAGIPRAGWHDITVKVPKSDKFTVRARKGYFGG